MAVKMEVTKELSNRALQLIEVARNTGKLRKGTNETTKAIDRGIAKLVVIATDVEPKEVVMHLPALCDEKKIPYVFVASKMDLGRSAGLDVPSAAIGVVEIGDGKELYNEIVAKVKSEEK